MNILDQSSLGKNVEYASQYDPELLFPILRHDKRVEIGVSAKLPFFGFDLWNHYEVSWLNEKGKPMVALAEIYYDCASHSIIESKSMKLYFNSLNQTMFSSRDALSAIIQKDIADRIGAPVSVKLSSLQDVNPLVSFQGICLDDLDIACNQYSVDHSLLTIEKEKIEETIYSNLLKSNCLITHQPDWCSVQITYKGNKIHHENLLRYLVSFRNHNEFHEQCIERIFMDIMHHCDPEKLTIYGRFTRRGGLNINH